MDWKSNVDAKQSSPIAFRRQPTHTATLSSARLLNIIGSSESCVYAHVARSIIILPSLVVSRSASERDAAVASSIPGGDSLPLSRSQ